MVQTISDLCCGCGACENVCPVNAIHYIPNKDGFYTPIVDENKCIRCGLCLKKCPLKTPPTGSRPRAVYACRNQDEQVLHKSSSGGVFSALAKKVLHEGGTVFGCSWDGQIAKHTEVTSITDLPKLYKSKYVQSNIAGVHKQIKERLKEGKTVLFCGTPCQVAGLKAGLESHPNLITVDFICHGVPSSKVLKKHIKDLETTYQATLSSLCFRDKDYGWNELQMTAFFSDGQVYSKPASQDSYYRAFLCNLSLNKGCGDCKFNHLPRASDITLGDFWNVGNHHPRFDDNKGVSCVVLNSDAGVDLFASIQKQLTIEQSSVEAVMDGNPFLNGHCTLHKRRNKFFSLLDYEPFDALVKRCLKPTPTEWFIEVLKYKLGIK